MGIAFTPAFPGEQPHERLHCPYPTVEVPGFRGVTPYDQADTPHCLSAAVAMHLAVRHGADGLDVPALHAQAAQRTTRPKVTPALVLQTALEEGVPTSDGIVRLPKYRRLYGQEEWYRALSDHAPILVALGVHANFWDAGDVVELPPPGSWAVGAHGLLVYAMDREYVDVLNSWGPRWKRGGHGRLPITYPYLFRNGWALA